ncbi:phosphonate ABC transporter ATP-binding protein [Alkalimarinus alittae]|uniref:Phosphonate ABC transporter ATP-binding protein n=1 Tax=Alkalimarinus alittae TaxID=2961619 RepID=A0ABY6N2A3_9ALTE|nr:phosphonate ABC transporter ATP-binding protein [Alkalimarinus alittae]UZE96238.1 phosphonate ABC transporter ATP-binding protein [Alkalimarinus alittae]
MDNVVQIKSLHKTFNSSNRALKGIDLSVLKGEMVALIGPSGSGKSTLLRHMAGLTWGDRGGQGSVSILGETIQKQGKLAHTVRHSRAKIGYIFQQFNLVNRMSVINNVLMGRLGRISSWRGTLGIFTQEERSLALKALARVGMEKYAYQRADTLSGGQQQRVAIARALMQKAEIILADEPIASLDPESSRIVMDILKDINEKDGKTVIVTLHQVEYARKYCGRAVALKNGELYFDGPSEELSDKRLANIYGASQLSVDTQEAHKDSEKGSVDLGISGSMAFAEAG